MAHQDEFLVHILQIHADIDALRHLVAPLLEVLVLLLSTSEEEEPATRIFRYQLLEHLGRLFRGIDLSLVGCKRGDAYPLLTFFLLAKDFWQLVDVALLVSGLF